MKTATLLFLTAIGALGCGGTSEPIAGAELPICSSVESIVACSGHAADRRLCAVCTSGSASITDCHAFRDAAQGTGVTGPAVIVDYRCVSACGECQD